MIGFLRGEIIELGLETAVIDVAGVGYETFCSTQTLDTLEVGVQARLTVHTHVREDAITLFGFSTPVEKSLFLALLKVNGVGPKMAIKILSSGPLENLLGMIETGDIKGLSGLPKVGKKTAEQLVLSLRGKLALERSPAGAIDGRPKLRAQGSFRFSGARADIASALVNLGFRAQDVERVVDELPETIELEQGVRRGLSALAGGAT